MKVQWKVRITMTTHTALVAATIPPEEVIFETEFAKKLRGLSFQDPEKIADGLSYIWDEKQKWEKIGKTLGLPPGDVRTRMTLISVRRNAIVH
jgi:hypothetical protein